MSSHDLLEILTSGAAFGDNASKSRKAKAHTSRDMRPELDGQELSLNFFAPVANTMTKRKRESTEVEGVQAMTPGISRPDAIVVQAEAVVARQKSSGHGSSKSKSGHSGGIALFRRGGSRALGHRTEDTASTAIHETDDTRARTIRQEEIACFRKKMGIRVRGEDVADPMESFLDMPQAGPGQDASLTRRVLLENVEESEWKEPTPVQMQAVPVLVAGRDLLAAAPTGSGKTAAFVMPIILRLGERCADAKAVRGVRGILLAPTRELAAQIHRDVVRLSRGRKMRVCLLTKSGVAKAAETSGVSGYDIIVSTPMRLVALLREETISLATVKIVVLDEADKLFDAGGTRSGIDSSFVGQVDEILAACSHRAIQRALFSATIGHKVFYSTKLVKTQRPCDPPQSHRQVRELAESVLRNPVFLTVGTENAGATEIDQRLAYVGTEEGKLLAIRQLVQDGLRPPVLIFLQSKDRAKALFHELVYDGINAEVMHASRTQDQRDRIIQRFRTGEIWVLICTDLMARGIDFKGVNMVINYDFPQSAVTYIHRIGRTGRAGRHGVAVTLFTESDMDSLRSVANVMRLSGCKVPDWMLNMKKERGSDRRKRETGAPRRHSISTVSKHKIHKKRRQLSTPKKQTAQMGKNKD